MATATLVKDGPRVRLVSRNMKNLTDDDPSLTAAGSAVNREDTILDGGTVSIDEKRLPSFQALQYRST